MLPASYVAEAVPGPESVVEVERPGAASFSLRPSASSSWSKREQQRGSCRH